MAVLCRFPAFRRRLSGYGILGSRIGIVGHDAPHFPDLDPREEISSGFKYILKKRGAHTKEVLIEAIGRRWER